MASMVILATHSVLARSVKRSGTCSRLPKSLSKRESAMHVQVSVLEMWVMLCRHTARVPVTVLFVSLLVMA